MQHGEAAGGGNRQQRKKRRFNNAIGIGCLSIMHSGYYKIYVLHWTYLAILSYEYGMMDFAPFQLSLKSFHLWSSVNISSTIITLQDARRHFALSITLILL